MSYQTWCAPLGIDGHCGTAVTRTEAFAKGPGVTQTAPAPSVSPQFGVLLIDALPAVVQTGRRREQHVRLALE